MGDDRVFVADPFQCGQEIMGDVQAFELLLEIVGQGIPGQMRVDPNRIAAVFGQSDVTQNRAPGRDQPSTRVGVIGVA